MRHEGEGYRHMLLGRRDEGRAALRRAAGAYRASWDVAPPRSFGRLVASLKTTIIAGDAHEAREVAAWVRAELEAAARDADEPCDSPTSCYALAVAALVEGDVETAAVATMGMRGGGDPAFGRAADALAALARADTAVYRTALGAIVVDFEARKEHLTGVRVADTALMVEVIAADRGMAARPASDLMPPGI